MTASTPWATESPCASRGQTKRCGPSPEPAPKRAT
nr:MAG TPA: hypothetical protein [Caudoviricetes sp.]